MDGILPLWKPKGMTSHDCVVKVRRLFSTKKVGHTGTLDPGVEGVLPICIGQGTKIVPFLMDTNKTYVAELMLGSATDTEDSEGNIVSEQEVTTMPNVDEVNQVLQSFKGQITQIPPMYSAVKVKGKRLYEYARNNEEVERPKRQVVIHEIKQLPVEKASDKIIKFEVTCSKGTYIRTLCTDIGQKLGYPAHMHHLVRLATGSLDKKDTYTFDIIEKAVKQGKQNELLLPISKGLTHLDSWSVNQETKKRVQHGQKLPKPEQITFETPFAVMYNDQLLAIYQIHPDQPKQIKPVRVFTS